MTIAGRALAAAERSRVAPFYVMRVLAAAQRRAEAGLPVWNLVAGQPATPAPGPVLAAARTALDGHVLGYTEAIGTLELRQAIAQHYRDWYAVDVNPAQVCVTTGSSGGFLLAFLAAFSPGDRVGLARPGYPAYRNILSALGCEVVDVPCGLDSCFRLTPDQLDDIHLDGLVLASPANPTGTVLPAPDLTAVIHRCVDRGIRLISDEIYHGIVFGAGPERKLPPAEASVSRGTCSWQIDRSGLVVNSFSKYFSMTGWRIGWLLLPDELVDPVDALAGNLAICPPVLSQLAAVSAFQAYAECDAHVRRYAANRAVVVAGLRELGIDKLAPADGAFYVYADVSHLTDDSQAWCAALLDQVGLAITPGLDFDPVDGHRFVRFSLAGSDATMRGGLDALARFLSA